MVLTDTHTHIYYSEETLQQELIDRCLENGITRLFLPNVDVSSIAQIDSLTARYPEMCFAMAGLHPCEVREGFRDTLVQIYDSIAGRKIYAIGEIGIDLYWDKTTLDLQQEAFAAQIRWAIDIDLPIVIHCREAFDQVFEVLEQERHERLRGIFHCFTGNLRQAQRAISMKFDLGIGGVVTYKNGGLDKVLVEVSPEHIVLETDAPYLAPVPFRGKPNESSYLIHIAKKVADIYGMPLEELAAITTGNSKRIFKI